MRAVAESVGRIVGFEWFVAPGPKVPSEKSSMKPLPAVSSPSAVGVLEQINRIDIVVAVKVAKRTRRFPDHSNHRK